MQTVSYDEELEAVLERQYQELLRRREELERRRKLQQLAEEAKKQEILRMILTPEARERLANLRLVRPDLAKIVEDHLVALALQGRIARQITEEELKTILAEVYERTRKEYRINIREK
ncbi:MAG: DNA-binding protein [Crenarchaeota archaeon]|nr:DNA-binding protein [Thermoproteota archaeon]